MHRYTVELRILGQALDPDEVTRSLGLVPTTVGKKGEPKIAGAGSKWASNMWGFEVLPAGRDDWSSLEDGLTALLRALGPVRDRLRTYLASHEVWLWCGHFTSSFDGGPVLSPNTLRLLGDFGIQLVLDTYCERTEELSMGKKG